jgi:hypothetical protein
MKCRDYQFTLGETHEMPEGSDIRLCNNGFHLCGELKDVFNFYPIGQGNRFFKVKALVKRYNTDEIIVSRAQGRRHPDKYVAKTIIFERELTIDEIFEGREEEHWADEYKAMAIEMGLYDTRNRMRINRLIDSGFSAPLAALFVERGLGDLAAAVGAAYTVGNREGKMQPATMFFTVGGVDVKKVDADIARNWDNFYRKEASTTARSIGGLQKQGKTATGRSTAFRSVFSAALRRMNSASTPRAL